MGRRRFLITGTQTGGKRAIALGRLLRRRGVRHRAQPRHQPRRRPSRRPSRSPTARSTTPRRRRARCFHVHAPELWRGARALGLPTTRPDVPYGTPAMAREVERLFRGAALRRARHPRDARPRGRRDRLRRQRRGRGRDPDAPLRARARRAAAMRVRGRDLRAVWSRPTASRTSTSVGCRTRSSSAGRATSMRRRVAIEDMGVRGAPAIGVFAAYALALAARRDGEAGAIDAAYARLLATRPTAVNLRHGLDAVRARRARSRRHARRRARVRRGRGRRRPRRSARTAWRCSRPGARVLTHCNAGWLAVQDWGTALAPVYKAARAGLDPFVWVSETRPRLQGARLTAWELAEEGVRHALVADGACARPDAARRGRRDLHRRRPHRRQRRRGEQDRHLRQGAAPRARTACRSTSRRR